MNKVFISAIFVLASYSAVADEMSEALTSMCENIKQCSMKRLEQSQDLSPAMKAQMAMMFDQTCAGMNAKLYGSGRSIPSALQSSLELYQEHGFSLL